MPADETLAALTAPAGMSGRTALDCSKGWAEEAGEIALARFRQPQDVTIKGRGDLLTETDLQIEQFLKHSIEREFPRHGILSEETASDASTRGWVWVVDPLDGTKNFVSGIPFFAVNMALCFDGEPIVAVTRDPNHDETFWAERGAGAWRDDEPIQASQKAAVRESVLGVDLGYDDTRGRAMLGMVHRLFPNVQSLRIPGSAALGLAYAACARYDLFVHHYLFPWDLAAGMLLTTEAGGAVTDIDGNATDIHSKAVVAGGRSVRADFVAWANANKAHLDQLD
jgi:fructose-1,6-bisphosphatase/inositol monophosphatase family enzyme